MTPFGIIFLAALFYILIIKKSWLPGLILASAALQATSVLNLPVGNREFGISPYNITALIIFSILLVRLTTEKKLISHAKLPIKPFILLVIYFIIAIPGAFLLPHLFDDLKVYLLFDPFPMDADTVALRWTLSNAVQAINLCVHAVVLVFLIQSISRNDWNQKNTINILGVGFLFVLGANFWERIAFILQWPSTNSFWVNNPGYYISSLTNFDFVGLRIGTPFSEPSYASVYFASVGVGLLAVASLGKNWRSCFAMAIICFIALLNSFGATGWAAAGLSLIALLLLLSFKAIKNNDAIIRLRAFIAWFFVLIIAIILIWLLFYSPWSQEINRLLNALIVSKFYLNPTEARHSSNLLAFNILQNTWGLGVGLGSNRASSYFASLISNTGILGFVFFTSMLISLLARYWRATHLHDIQIFSAASLSTATLGVGLGIPDLNLPMYWGFIFLSFIFYPDDDQMKKNNPSKLPDLSLNDEKWLSP